MSRTYKTTNSVESEVEVMSEACRYCVLEAGVGAYRLRCACVECAHLAIILRLYSPRLRATLL